MAEKYLKKKLPQRAIRHLRIVFETPGGPICLVSRFQAGQIGLTLQVAAGATEAVSRKDMESAG